MAKEKNAVDKSRNRDLGTITKKTASGFYETNKEGVKVPGLHGFKVGDKVKLVDGEYVINGGKPAEEETKGSSNLSEVNTRFEKLETELADMIIALADIKIALADVKIELADVKTELADVKTDIISDTTAEPKAKES